MAPNHCFTHPGLGKQRAKRGACPSRAAEQPLWAVGAARRAHSLCELPREHCRAAARPESDLKYETNGSNSPSESCCSRRVPAVAFQPFLAGTHCQNGDALFPHHVCRFWGNSEGSHGLWFGLCGGCRRVHASSGKTRAVLPAANQAASDLCHLQRSKL